MQFDDEITESITLVFFMGVENYAGKLAFCLAKTEYLFYNRRQIS
jgi:hypothetical protein